MPSGVLMLTLLLYDQVVKTHFRGLAAATWYTIKTSKRVEQRMMD